MKSLARFALASGFAAAVSLFGARASADMKLAVVDSERAVLSTEDGLRAQATLKKLFDSRTQEISKRGEELTKQRDDLQKQQRVLSKDAFEKRVGEFQKQAGEFERMQMEVEQEVGKRKAELLGPIVDRVTGAIKRLAASEGYDLVLEKRAAPFSRGDLDLTDRVIQIANGGAGASTAPSKAPSSAPTPATPAAAPTK